MTPTRQRRTFEERAELGSAFFDRDIRATLRPADDGKFIAIDIACGGHEIDEDDYAAVSRLRLRKPTVEIWLMRVGFPATYRI